jgi:hypothetical protein
MNQNCSTSKTYKTKRYATRFGSLEENKFFNAKINFEITWYQVSYMFIDYTRYWQYKHWGSYRHFNEAFAKIESEVLE